uniref:Uncharacterized protein n=1 Tax=Macrostomum lignano TaxID=282301 RepID=A0A1I8FHT0_9PLAT
MTAVISIHLCICLIMLGFIGYAPLVTRWQRNAASDPLALLMSAEEAIARQPTPTRGQKWSVWTQECTGRLADQFPSDARQLRDRASAVSQFSTRQRPCRCLAVKQQQQQPADGLSEDCRCSCVGDIRHLRCSIIWRRRRYPRCLASPGGQSRLQRQKKRAPAVGDDWIFVVSATPAAWTRIYRPGPGEATDDANRDRFADGDEEASGRRVQHRLGHRRLTASGELTPL